MLYKKRTYEHADKRKNQYKKYKYTLNWINPNVEIKLKNLIILFGRAIKVLNFTQICLIKAHFWFLFVFIYVSKGKEK